MQSVVTSLTRSLALVTLAFGLMNMPLLAAPLVTITGTVVSQTGSLPIADANLQLLQGTATVATTRSTQDGSFSFKPVAAGTYVIVVRAIGFEPGRTDELIVGGTTATVLIALRRAASTSDVRELGRVVVSSSRAAGLQTTMTIQHDISPSLLQQTNQIRLAEGLGKLPGVNAIGLDSAVGDDIAIDIRGLKPSETQVLLDGHPIGPLGVFPGSIGGGSGGFNFQDSPLFAVENTLVTYGSGAVGLYGVDAVGGSVDLQTINPTLVPHAQLKYGIAEQGKQIFGAQFTGTEGRIGYVVLHGVSGTYGDFPQQTVSQTGLRGGDLTAATLANITYPVSANYVLRNDLAKLRYAFSPKTSLTFTAYSATSWDDKTGNGDNDFITPEFATLRGQSNTNCTTPSGLPGVMLTTDNGNPCVTPQVYGQLASGPAGGGPGAFQALRNQDFHLRFLTAAGRNQIVVDFFSDNFAQDRQRSLSVVNGDLNVLTNIYRTFGALISDDIASDKNDIGFGIYTQRQYINGNALSGSAGIIPHTPTKLKLDSVFVREAFTPSERLSFFANAWFKHSLLGGNSFDPRLSVVFRPGPADVIRLTGGGSSADPAPIPLTLTGAGGINPGNCQTWGLGSAPSAGELPEKATDLEFSIAHRFIADTNVQLTGYDTRETNAIFEGSLPAANFLSQIATYGPQYIPGVLTHVQAVCNLATPPVFPDQFTISTNLNLAKSRARGLELSSRLRLTPELFFDSYYNVQSTTIFDAPNDLLMANPTLIPGAQLPRLPLHKFGISGDWATRSGAELYMNYTHYDANNELNRPAYGLADASITQRLNAHLSLNVGISNLFNTAPDNYGRIGIGTFLPENVFGTDTNAVMQGSERFGLAPQSFSVTLTEHI